MDWLEDAKKRAATRAVKHVEEGFVVGLGSGTTVAYALRELGRRIREENLCIYGVPTSSQSFLLAVKNKISVTTLYEYPHLNVTIDGADQIDEKLNTIKGMGGALTREKIVASASEVNIIVVDETKLVETLGSSQPVPIEVLPFAVTPVVARLKKLGSKPSLREAKKKLGPVVTDNGNFILDVDFGPIEDPAGLNQMLKGVPGIVETGLFVGLADIAYVGGRETVQKLGSKVE